MFPFLAANGVPCVFPFPLPISFSETIFAATITDAWLYVDDWVSPPINLILEVVEVIFCLINSSLPSCWHQVIQECWGAFDSKLIHRLLKL